MNVDESKQGILELLGRKGGSALTAGDIAAALQLRAGAKKQLAKWLHQLVTDGEIVQIRSNRYALGAEADLVTGVLSVARSGNGYVGSPDGDVFVSQPDLHTALPGDKVMVRLATGPAAEQATRRSGKVIRIVERGTRDIVGTLRSTGRFFYVVPMSPGYSQDFYVPEAKGAKVEDRVIIRFTGWEHKHVNPEAEVIEVLGPVENASLDTRAILAQYGYTEEFPEAVIRQAETAMVAMRNPGQRLDLRDKLIITVDPERAKDFDDALSLEQTKAGERVLGVHIADVSHFVKRGGALDQEALRRGNSAYFPDRVIPMLPEQLSNGLCSLRPDEDRLALSAFLTVDASGRVTRRHFAKTLIRSKKRLTYEQALVVLEGGSRRGNTDASPEVQQLLNELHKLAQQMRRRRFERFALELDVPACEVQIDEKGMMTGIKVLHNDISHQMIEECMVAANEAVATELCGKNLAGIHRVHEPPREEKIEDLRAELETLGFRSGDLSDRRNLAHFLKSIADEPLSYHLKTAVLRSMNRAVYSASPDGHYALAKKYYGHFTSPIRRYPDLVLHRQLSALLAGGEQRYYTRDEAAQIAMSCTKTEWNADDAERDLLEIKKLRFMDQELKSKRPTVYDAVVVNVMNFGLFVELLELQIQGLVHVSSISDRFVTHNRRRNVLQDGKDAYGVGKALKVRVVRVDFDKRRVDFVLATP